MSQESVLDSNQDGGAILRDRFGGNIREYLQAIEQEKRLNQRKAAAVRLREFNRWRTMIRRCTDPTADSYPYYGGEGVAVCDRWLTFDHFFADMGPAPEGKTLDRIDPAGWYSPENCRWATPSEQEQNKRSKRAPRGSVTLIDGRWRALVRIKGQAKSRRFTQREEAVAWAEATAAQLSA